MDCVGSGTVDKVDLPCLSGLGLPLPLPLPLPGRLDD